MCLLCWLGAGWSLHLAFTNVKNNVRTYKPSRESVENLNLNMPENASTVARDSFYATFDLCSYRNAE